MNKLVQINNLSIKNREKTLLDNISFTLNKGEILGVVGKSGSGKSLLCKAILNILPENLKKEGEVEFNSINKNFVLGKDISVIWQDALNSFDPLYTIQEHMQESFLKKIDKKESKEVSLNLLKKVGIKDYNKAFKSYPNELSGGELQRVMIAIALLQDTKLIIADEPTSSLDLITQKQIIELIKGLNKTIIFVTHDLALISNIANKILVLNSGNIEDYGAVEEVFNSSKSSYTKKLILDKSNLSQRFLQCLK